VKVAVTATADTAERIRRALDVRGLEGVVLPCVVTRPRDEGALRRVRGLAATVDWIVVTSARAVRTLWPDGGMPPVPVAAVGPATAEAVAAAGGRVALVGTEGAASLLRRLEPEVGEATVLYPRPERTAADVETTLRAAGAEVIAATVYTTLPVPPPTEPVVDAVTFASPSAVLGWRRSRTLEGLVVAALGSTTAAAVKALGHPVDVVAETPSPERLVDSLVRHLEGRSPT